ncbi:hypothetical protein GCM10010232_46150 [Streptomyces amakusaensis]
MKGEPSASVCCSCEATRMSVEKGVPVGVSVAMASKAVTSRTGGGRTDGMRTWPLPPPIILLRFT